MPKNSRKTSPLMRGHADAWTADLLMGRLPFGAGNWPIEDRRSGSCVNSPRSSGQVRRPVKHDPATRFAANVNCAAVIRDAEFSPGDTPILVEEVSPGRPERSSTVIRGGNGEPARCGSPTRDRGGARTQGLNLVNHHGCAPVGTAHFLAINPLGQPL